MKEINVNLTKLKKIGYRLLYMMLHIVVIPFAITLPIWILPFWVITGKGMDDVGEKVTDFFEKMEDKF